jgi:hypothetical protein
MSRPPRVRISNTVDDVWWWVSFIVLAAYLGSWL